MLQVSELLTVSELSRQSGISRQSVYRAIRDGRLSRYLITAPDGRRLLEPEALEFCTNGGIRGRRDSPWMQWSDAPAVPDGPRLEHVAGWGNALIDAAAWGPPPWTVEQWQSLRVVLEQAIDLAGSYGPFDPVLLESLANIGADLADRDRTAEMDESC
jgi:hypothetical protein